MVDTIEIGMTDGFLNEDDLTLTVNYSSDGWDSRKQWRKDLKLAAKLSNDTITEEVDDALIQVGYELDDNGHVFDEDEEEIIFKIREIE
jgi:hypothetical protein